MKNGWGNFLPMLQSTPQVWSQSDEVTLQQISSLHMCRGTLWERWTATPGKKCPLNNSLSVPRISRIHPGCHASCCHVVTWSLFPLSASAHWKAFIFAKNVLELFSDTRYLIRIFWGLIKIHHLIVVKGQLIFASWSRIRPWSLVIEDGVRCVGPVPWKSVGFYCE